MIYLVKGSQKGQKFWHYVKVEDHLKRLRIKKEVASGPFDVKDYGEILCSGWGEEPPAHIRKQYDEA